MEKTNIPDKINAFKVYGNKSELVGVSGEVSLPDIESVTSAISGAGIAGEIDTPAIGIFNSIEQEIPFTSVYSDCFSIYNPLKAVTLTLRGSLQVMNRETGSINFKGVKVTFKGLPKKITGGTVKLGEGITPSVTLELLYYKLEVDSNVMIEVDKLNSVFKVNGVDILKNAISLC